MAAPVPYRNRKPRTPEGRALQRQVQGVADAVTADRVKLELSQRPGLGETRLWPNDFDSPSGWLLCDGTAVRRQAYPELFKVAGTTAPFGPGDGATSFDLPDLTGWVPAGFSAYIYAGRA